MMRRMLCFAMVHTNWNNGVDELDISPEEQENLKRGGTGWTAVTSLTKWKLVCPGSPFPAYDGSCVCGHPILKNCWLVKGENYITVGSCCVKKFIKERQLLCEKCQGPHRNRKVNRCNKCREKPPKKKSYKDCDIYWSDDIYGRQKTSSKNL